MSIDGLTEITLIVNDLDKMTAFYEEAVGLERERGEGGAPEGWAWFRLSESPVQRLALTTKSVLYERYSPEADREPTFGPACFALRLPLEGVNAAERRLRAGDVEMFGPNHSDFSGGTTRSFYDPEGNLVRCFTPDEAAKPDETSEEPDDAGEDDASD